MKNEGVSPGEPVLLWMGNSPHWVGTFLGILLRGGVAVPLHVESLPEFIRKVSLQTGARLLLKSSSLKFPLSGLKIVPRRRGTVRVSFGAALRFQKTDSYAEATARIEQALRELQERSPASPRP